MIADNKYMKERILRPIIIGTILSIANCYWIVMSEAMWFTVHITVISIFFNAVFAMFIILLFNQLARKYMPKASLSNSELLIIYVMMNMASAMAGHGLMQLLIPIMVMHFGMQHLKTTGQAFFIVIFQLGLQCKIDLP